MPSCTSKYCDLHEDVPGRPIPRIMPVGCLRCLNERQKRVVVPYVDFSIYYVRKYASAPREVRKV